MANNKNRQTKNNYPYKNTNTKNKNKRKDIDKFDNIDLSVTQQQQLIFDDEALNSSLNLDTSFMEDKSEAKRKKKIEKVLVENSKNNQNNKCYIILIIVLLFLCVILAVLSIFNFNNKSNDSNKDNVVITKTIDSNYLFLGDSQVDNYDLDKFYEGLNVVNSGVNGDTTEKILNNMKNRVYQYNPSKVFIEIGVNDLTQKKTSEEVVLNIKKIIKLIKENRPYCKIYLESIYPLNKTDDEKIDEYVRNLFVDNELIIKTNELLMKLALEEEIDYINIYDKLVDEDGNLKLEYTKEGQHISDMGYERITEILMKYIDD